MTLPQSVCNINYYTKGSKESSYLLVAVNQKCEFGTLLATIEGKIGHIPLCSWRNRVGS